MSVIYSASCLSHIWFSLPTRHIEQCFYMYYITNIGSMIDKYCLNHMLILKKAKLMVIKTISLPLLYLIIYKSYDKPAHDNYLLPSSPSRMYKPFHAPFILSNLSVMTPKFSSSSICSSTNHASRLSTLWSPSALASSTRA